MDSIFKEEDYRANGTASFWTQGSGEVPSTDVLIEGILSIHKMYGATQELTTRFFVLSRDTLYCCKTNKDRRTKRSSVVLWKCVHPFVEQASGAPDVYGFTMSSTSGISQDFFVSDQPTLDTWLHALSPISICSDLMDDYELVKELYVSTGCKVLLAKNRDNHSLVAVKQIAKVDLQQSKRKLQGLIREIEIHRTLSHPNLIKLIRVYEDQRLVSLVTDYYPGGDLFSRIQKQGSLSILASARVISNLLQGLAYLHENGIMHRDIKLENILLESKLDEINCKIIDFGLSLRVGDDLGARCGSPGYVAPEILMKKSYGVGVDVYSAGVVLYVLLSGRSPFTGTSMTEILANNKKSTVEFKKKYWQHVPPHARNLVLRMMEPNPDLRISAKEALTHPWIQDPAACNVRVGIRLQSLPGAKPSSPFIPVTVPKRRNLSAPGTFLAEVHSSKLLKSPKRLLDTENGNKRVLRRSSITLTLLCTKS